MWRNSVSNNECFQIRRFEQLEERLRVAENALTQISSELHISNNNLKEEIERIRADIKERVHDLKSDINNDFKRIDDALNNVSENVETLTKSLQNLYVSHSGSTTKINLNEKIIWILLTFFGTTVLYIIQEFLKGVSGGN